MSNENLDQVSILFTAARNFMLLLLKLKVVSIQIQLGFSEETEVVGATEYDRR